MVVGSPDDRCRPDRCRAGISRGLRARAGRGARHQETDAAGIELSEPRYACRGSGGRHTEDSGWQLSPWRSTTWRSRPGDPGLGPAIVARAGASSKSATAAGSLACSTPGRPRAPTTPRWRLALSITRCCSSSASTGAGTRLRPAFYALAKSHTCASAPWAALPHWPGWLHAGNSLTCICPHRLKPLGLSIQRLQCGRIGQSGACYGVGPTKVERVPE